MPTDEGPDPDCGTHGQASVVLIAGTTVCYAGAGIFNRASALCPRFDMVDDPL